VISISVSIPTWRARRLRRRHDSSERICGHGHDRDRCSSRDVPRCRDARGLSRFVGVGAEVRGVATCWSHQRRHSEGRGAPVRPLIEPSPVAQQCVRVPPLAPSDLPERCCEPLPWRDALGKSSSAKARTTSDPQRPVAPRTAVAPVPQAQPAATRPSGGGYRSSATPRRCPRARRARCRCRRGTGAHHYRRHQHRD